MGDRSDRVDALSGHHDALAELRLLESESDLGLEIVRVIKPENHGNALFVDVSIDCQGIEESPNGLKLRSRERFVLCIDEDFPLNPPSVFAADHRFAFHDHVYWVGDFGVYLCVYYSVEHQWQPEHGMCGFIYRFAQWLEDASAGKLDQRMQPMHPPQVRGDYAKEFFVVRADCPPVNGAWLGYAVFDRIHEQRMDLVKWVDSRPRDTSNVLAPAILIDTPFVSEFPKYVGTLLQFLERMGIDQEVLAARLMVHARHTSGRPPMYLVFGVAMRGTVGERAEQHLVIWRIDKRGANDLRNLARKRKRLSKKGADTVLAEGAALIDRWKGSSGQLTYCRVYEDRPTVVLRRDQGSGIAWFGDKTVTLWGAGALGSQIAENLVRAGVAELRVVDYGRVTPGVLVRQNYRDRDIGNPKVCALVPRLKAINPAVKVLPVSQNLLKVGYDLSQTLSDTDILVDATASQRVALLIDRLLVQQGPLPYPIVTLANDSRAKHGFGTLTAAGHELGPTDLLQRAFLRLCRMNASEWLDAFWPTVDEDAWFEPEPGCSAPTFRGGHADAGALAGGMLSRLGDELTDAVNPTVLLGSALPVSEAGGHRFEFAPGSHQVCPESGFEVRFLPEVSAAMQSIVDAEQRQHPKPKETGGVLYGYINHFLRVIWVVDASPPPLDSRSSRSEFVCGVEGVSEATANWQATSSGLVGFVGTWHSHPVNSAEPSVVDLNAMRELLKQSGSPRHHLVLTIVSHNASKPAVVSYVFGGDLDSNDLQTEEVGENDEDR